MKWTLLQAAHVSASYLLSSESGSSSIQYWTLIEVLGQVKRKAGINPYMAFRSSCFLILVKFQIRPLRISN